MSKPSIEHNGHKIKYAMKDFVSFWSAPIGCYHCQEVMFSFNIEQSTPDGYALCPYCGVDALILNGDAETLAALRLRMFG